MDVIPTHRLLLTAAIYACLTVVAFAQPPGGFRGPGGFGGPGGRGPGGPGGPGGKGELLRSEEVRAELEIVDSQLKELRALEEEMRDRMRSEMRDRFRQMRESEDRDAMRTEMRAAMEDFQAEAQERLGEILTAAQIERLDEIRTQQLVKQRGSRGLIDGPLAEELGISDEQKEQLRERSRELQKGIREQMDAAQAEAREQLLEILSSEQREQLQSMMGDEFELTQPTRGGEFGRRRGGGGRQGRGGPGGRRGGFRPPAE